MGSGGIKPTKMDSLAEFNKLRKQLRTRIATLLSPTFAIDSIGTKTITVPHGFYFIPSVQEISLTVIEDTNVDDWGYTLLKVESVDATNVVAKINVTLASLTGGATAKLGVTIISLGDVTGYTLAPDTSDLEGAWRNQLPPPIFRKKRTPTGGPFFNPYF